jgi:hypothetical protein
MTKTETVRSSRKVSPPAFAGVDVEEPFLEEAADLMLAETDKNLALIKLHADHIDQTQVEIDQIIARL